MKEQNRSGRVNFKSFTKAGKTTLFILMATTLLLGALIPVLLSSNMLFSIKTSRTYQANELSDEDLLSPISFSYIDEEKTEAMREKAAWSICSHPIMISYAAIREATMPVIRS